MKKTFNISINNTPFTIEEDAYQKLDAYLTAIKAHFGDNVDKDEIIKDIEARIAEKLSELAHSIVTEKDVDSIIEDMGTINQFDGDYKEETPAGTKTKKRLYRDTDTAIIAGVSSGIAHYFGIDPVIIRLIFIITVLLGGSGILIYLILWFAIPEAETTAQKLEMRGDPVTLSTMSESIKEKFESIDPNKIKAGAEKMASAPGSALRGFANFIQDYIFPAVRVIIGSIFMLGAFLVGVGTTIAFGIALFAVPASFLSSPVANLIHDPLLYVFGTGLYFAFLIPSILVFFWGIGIIRHKAILNKTVGWSLFIIWVIAIVIGGIGASRTAVRANEIISSSPAFKTESRELDLEEFSKLSVSNSMAISYVQGKTYGIVINGPAYNLDRMEVSVDENVLSIKNTDSQTFCFFVCHQGNVTAIITAPSLEDISVRRASKLTGAMTTTVPVTMSARDASSISMDFDGKVLIASARDASSITLTGSTTSLDLTLSDASRFNGEDLESTTAVVDVRDASRATINVSEKLKATARDASSIKYSGSPSVEKETSDASSIKKIQSEE